MATAVTTRNTPILAPPSTDSGVLGWLRKNLFGSAFDTILTLLAAGFLYLLLHPLHGFFTLLDFLFLESGGAHRGARGFDAAPGERRGGDDNDELSHRVLPVNVDSYHAP